MAILCADNRRKKESSRRLLLLGCSSHKRSDPELLPALERYDGPAFRLTRKYKREVESLNREMPDVWVFSARFGLVSGQQILPNYDECLTGDRALELAHQLRQQTNGILEQGAYSQVAICMSKLYQQALSPCLELISVHCPNILVLEGSPGYRLSALRDWLESSEEKKESVEKMGDASLSIPNGDGFLRGQRITVDPQKWQQILCEVNDKAYTDTVPSVWFASVGGQPVPVKWLVSRLSDLPRSSFHTDEARRVLRQLGIKVMRR